MFKDMLCARGSRSTTLQLEKFLNYVQDVCPWFLEEGTMNPTTWDRVGEQLRERYMADGLENVPVETFSVWKLVKDSLDTKPEASRLPEAQPQTIAEKLRVTLEEHENSLPQGNE